MIAIRPKPKPVNSHTNFSDWVLACSLAEALGMAIVSVTYAAIDLGLLSITAGWILLAGAWESLGMGLAGCRQWL